MTSSVEVPPVGSRIGVLASAYLAGAAGTFSQASFEFMMVPLQSELGLSVDLITGLTLIPLAASLSAVFLVGTLGDRFGARRMLMIASMIFAIGAVLVMFATGWATVVLGRAIGGLGGIALSVTGLASLNQVATEPRERGRLFGYFAAAVPASFLIADLLASVISTNFSWRLVPITWIVLAAAVAIATWRARLPEPNRHIGGESWTPLLAGAVLAGIGVAAATAAGSPSAALVAIACSAVFLVIVAILMRSLPRPSLDLRLLRSPGALLLCAAVLAATSTNLFFFVNLFLQYRFPSAVVGISLLLGVPSVFAVIGGVAGGRLSARIGPLYAAAVTLFAAALLSLGFLLVTADSAIWLPVLILAVFAIPLGGMVGPLTQSLMERAAQGCSNAASAIKSATWSLGGIIGGVTLGALGFTVFTHSLAARLAGVGLDFPVARDIADQVRSGAFVSQLAERLSSTSPAAADMLAGSGTALHAAQVDGLHTIALLGLATFGSASLLVVLAARRIAVSPSSS